MYLLYDKIWKIFDKHMTLWEKVNTIIKKDLTVNFYIIKNI